MHQSINLVQIAEPVQPIIENAQIDKTQTTGNDILVVAIPTVSMRPFF
jgi:chromatin remodeling complex protein RSC6